MQKFWS